MEFREFMLREKRLLVYLTLGDPLIDSSLINAIKGAGADVVELGIPTPMAKYDGPVIKRSMKRALDKGLDESKSLELLPSIKGGPNVLFTYYELALKLGVEEVFNSANGRVNSILFPDLVIDYLDELNRYLSLCDKYGMEPTFFVTSNFPQRMIRSLSEREPTFVYLGLMMSTGILLPVSAERNIKNVRKLVGSTPLVVGFAIREPEQARRYVLAGSDGVVIGSGLLRLLENSADERERVEKVMSFVNSLKRAIKGEGVAG